MEETFKRIPPEDVFITVFKRKPTEEELWMGVPPDFDGNRPSISSASTAGWTPANTPA